MKRWAFLTCLLVAPGAPGCNLIQKVMSPNTVIVTEPTTEPRFARATGKTGEGDPLTWGMEVNTVGEDTLVSSLRGGQTRRFILKGLKGYTGEIRSRSVHLVFGEVNVWISEKAVKVVAPDYEIDEPLRDQQTKEDLFEGRDLIIERDQVTAAGGASG